MILIFGDSIVLGAWDEKGGWAQRIKGIANKKRFASDLQEGVTVYPLGISGNNSEKLLKRFDAEVEARKWEDEEIQIIIAIGINDSYFFVDEKRNSVPITDYEKNLLTIIEKSKEYNANLAFVGLTPVDERVDPVPWNPEISFKLEYIKEYDRLLKKTCEENNVSYFELLSKFESKDTKETLADGLHPSTKGHEIIYEEVLSFLRKKNFI